MINHPSEPRNPYKTWHIVALIACTVGVVVCTTIILQMATQTFAMLTGALRGLI